MTGQNVPCDNQALLYRVPLLPPGCSAGIGDETVSIDRGGYVDELALCDRCAALICMDATERGQTVVSRRMRSWQ